MFKNIFAISGTFAKDLPKDLTAALSDLQHNGGFASTFMVGLGRVN